jgi:DNA repair protein RadC
VLLATALNCGASAIIIAHNHPSGNKKPSNADIKMTTQINKACEIMDIQLLDHLIMTYDSYFSFADEGLLYK